MRHTVRMFSVENFMCYDYISLLLKECTVNLDEYNASMASVFLVEEFPSSTFGMACFHA